MMNTRNILALLAGLLLLTGCRELPAYFSPDRTVARVGSTKLHRSDLKNAVPQGVTGEDSIALTKIYIDRWVRKQIKLQEAEKVFEASVADIDRKVEEYRQTLLIHRLDEHLIDRELDTVFTSEQIAAYYDVHKGEFKLDRPLVKGRIVRFQTGYRQALQLRALMQGHRETQQQDFTDICLKNDFAVTDFGDKWVDFSEFLSHLPSLRTENYDSVLGTTDVQEMHDSRSHYYFQIHDVRRAGESIPLERIAPTIRRILYKQRQEAIIHKFEERIYEEAVHMKRVEYNDEEFAKADSTADKTEK